MKVLSRSVSIFLVLFILANSLILCEENSGEATGKKIGTIVKTAISTALPGVQTILDLIWKKKETTKDKITKEDLKKAIDAAKKDMQDEFVLNAQNKLKAIKTVATELEIINSFLYPTVKVKENLIKMKTLLSVNNNISDNLWDSLKLEMEVCNNYLKKINAFKDSELKKVYSIYVRDKLEKIKDANNDIVSRINGKIKVKNAEGLKGMITELYNIHKDITLIVGYEFDELQKDLKDLLDWTKGGQGDSTSLSERQMEIKKLLDQKYKK